MYKWFMFILFFTACTVGLVTMVVNTSGTTKEAAEATDENVLTLVATNYKFDQPEYKVANGQTLKVKLQNKEGKHAFEIQGLDVTIQAGETKEIAFNKPGTYDIVCTLPCGTGHATMTSKLVVQ